MQPSLSSSSLSAQQSPLRSLNRLLVSGDQYYPSVLNATTSSFFVAFFSVAFLLRLQLPGHHMLRSRRLFVRLLALLGAAYLFAQERRLMKAAIENFSSITGGDYSAVDGVQLHYLSYSLPREEEEAEAAGLQSDTSPLLQVKAAGLQSETSPLLEVDAGLQSDAPPMLDEAVQSVSTPALPSTASRKIKYSTEVWHCTHGFGSNSLSFQPFINAFQSQKRYKNVRIIAHDCPGFGFNVRNTIQSPAFYRPMWNARATLALATQHGHGGKWT
jgi:hypothetical protein